MNYTKKVISITILVLGIGFSLFGDQQIPQIGVVDVKEVSKAFFKKSQSYRQIEELKAQYKAEVNKLIERVKLLEEEVLEARKKGNDQSVLEKEKELNTTKQYVKDFIKVRENELDNLIKNLSQNNEYWNELTKAIRHVAEQGGYTIILDSSNSITTERMILYWAIEVDITKDVIEQLGG